MHPMLNIAVRAARDAGKVIIQHVNRLDSLKITDKGRNDFVSEVDRMAEAVIIDTLRKAYPNHAILAEESGSHRGDEYQWVIDPLDGTTNYLHGFPQFSVSIALRHKGVLDQAVVYDPWGDELFTASAGAGAWLDNRRMRVSSRIDLSGALLGTGFPYRNHEHLDAYLDIFRELILATAGIRRPGSAALDLAYVAAGRLDGFWEMNLCTWDIAAGALLIQEAGGIVTDFGSKQTFLESGNVIAGGPKVQALLLECVQKRFEPGFA
ncbi:MAG TPA: inositol monophosphatase [Chromatiaceae bacterium]|jgi:myo-inositol-1(or 4)-monophosphatase|nr:inositol monophosphatase [Chromatiaceae bacterium]HIB84900.1 inositol monophosphatase [Chromatiaceae bacterium]HIN82763.1 inositol monophosphatase [Chromatiales bacterium]HIO13952.1 inositol monophosphatase [Chromatiales bacterium]HIO54434.1 inositol monophosphatase [Chromatiales bacterium]